MQADTTPGSHATGSHAACAMQHAPCSMRHAACAMQHAPCSMRHAACAMQHAPCSMRVRCATQHAARNLRRAPCILHATGTAGRHGTGRLNPPVAAAVAVEAVRSGRGQHATRHNVPASQDGFGRAALRGRVHALWTSPVGSSDGCAHTPTVVRSLPSPRASPKLNPYCSGPIACANRLRLVVAPPPQRYSMSRRCTRRHPILQSDCRPC
jgi:hypothetical protein